MLSIPITIGYDPREAIAYHTCTNSIIRHASRPVSLIPLALNLFNNYSETHTDGSNQFIYSRFLTPYLMNYQGWAIFMDGDMIVRDDIIKLWELKDDSYAVQVVKHDYKTKMPVKYLGAKNEDYPCKNWSSVILWNCGHPKNKLLTPEFIQSATGAQLHRFTWLEDNEVGELPAEWNWLDVEYDWNPLAKLVHYTLGSPCFHEFADQGDFADEWHRERMYTDYCLQRGI